MLDKSRRLSAKADFSRVYKYGRTGRGQFVIVKALKNTSNTEPAESKIGVVVSKKISKKATARNRIKRQVASLIREHWRQIPQSYNIIVVVRVSLEKTDIKLLTQDVLAAIRLATEKRKT